LRSCCCYFSSLIQENDIKQTTGDAPNSPCFFPTQIPSGSASPGTGLTIYGSVNAQVIGNIIENNVAQAPPNTGDTTTCAGVFISGGTQIVLQNNVIRNNYAVGFGALNIAPSPTNLLVIENLIYGNSIGGQSDGEQVEISGTVQPPYPTLTEINNTFYGSQRIILSFAPSILANNIFVDPSSSSATYLSNYYGLWCADSFSERSPLTINNNDIFNTVGALQPSGNCPLGTGNISVDPQFLNATNSDFHTQPASPVVAAGDIHVSNIPITDLDGKARTVCGKIDMGVYEIRPHPPIVLTVTPNPSPGRSSVTLTATLTGNCNTPTGLVTFIDGSTVLGTAPVSGSGVATFTTSFLFVGTHTITAAYPGDFNFEDATSNAITEVITGPPTTTTLNSVIPNPAQPFQPITMTATLSSSFTLPTGTIAFLAGSKALATVPVASNGVASAMVNTLGPGTYTITAAYSGSTEYAGSTSNAITLVVATMSTATTLSAEPNPVCLGQPVAFQVGVASITTSSSVPTGTIQILDGTTSLGTATLSGGKATFSTSTLTLGSHTITAVYSGDSNFGPSTSPVVTEVVLASSFTIGLSRATITLSAGQHAQMILTGTSVGAYVGTLNLSNGQLPTHATLSFDPTTISLTGGVTASSTISINTGDLPPGVNKAKNSRPAYGFRLPLAFAEIATLPILLLRRRRLPVLFAILAVVLLASSTGCTNIYHPFNSVAPGTYVIPITATDSATQTTQTANLTLIVTP
jgi:Bacterial Ig-like domain (group 3)